MVDVYCFRVSKWVEQLDIFIQWFGESQNKFKLKTETRSRKSQTFSE